MENPNNLPQKLYLDEKLEKLSVTIQENENGKFSPVRHTKFPLHTIEANTAEEVFEKVKSEISRQLKNKDMISIIEFFNDYYSDSNYKTKISPSRSW